jgi:diaminopimelate decarboxylase
MDSFSELGRLEAAAAQRGVSVTAGVRLTANPHGLWRKFGIPLVELGRFFDEANKCRHVDLQGLQVHTSWNLDPSAQTDFIRLLGDTLRQLPSSHVSRLRFVDIGGGYWPEQGEWIQAAATPAGTIRGLLAPDEAPSRERYWRRGTPIEQFAEQLASAVGDHLTDVADVTICLEPGRWLCNDAMHLLMTVVDCKASDLVITDAGANAVGWERFETDFFPVVNLTRPAMTEHPCDIHGCLCTPHDIWGYSYWGQDIAPGDVLVVPSQGAYTYSLRQDFIKPIPATAVLGKARTQQTRYVSVP